VRLAKSFHEIDASLFSQDDPFASHAFLTSLEDAGCIGGKTGWYPFIFTDERELFITYVKTHSQGEYVFDHAFADASHRAGLRYYPKMQVATPFTPVSGRRLPQNQALIDAALDFMNDNGLSGLNVTFMGEDEQARLEKHGFLPRIDTQFHFNNDGYVTFDDFLTTLASRKRKAIRKERVTALEHGLSIERVTGEAITEAHLDDFFAFYEDTGARKWGQPYLNRAFFSLIRERMADRLLFIFAQNGEKRIAGAMNVIGLDRLYGRYWGATEHHACLHFEVCYYQAMDYAIENSLKLVEAGAQGEHKLARGYLPVKTFSAHFIRHEGLRAAVGDYLTREREAVSDMSEDMREAGPYKKL
jgi:uncharacterized protein